MAEGKAEMEEGERGSQSYSTEQDYWRMLLASPEVPQVVPEEKPPAEEPEEAERREEPVEAVAPPPEGKEGIWQRLQNCLTDGETFKCEVVGYNRGGLLVTLESLQGFVPASMVLGMPRGLNDDERKLEFASYMGELLELKIIELNPANSRVVLSERAAVPARERTGRVLDRITEGEVRRGRVSGICDFGAFVNLGGVDGLVHISELSWGRVANAGELLKVGDWVEVYVLKVDQERRRVALSLKRLQSDPWGRVEEKYQVGQLVKGSITKLVDFGAFAQLESGLEGLVHISELAEGDIGHPREVIDEGQEVTLRILKIDSQNRRMALSLRQV